MIGKRSVFMESGNMYGKPVFNKTDHKLSCSGDKVIAEECETGVPERPAMKEDKR